jgi:hypothetical protein
MNQDCILLPQPCSCRDSFVSIIITQIPEEEEAMMAERRLSLID